MDAPTPEPAPMNDLPNGPHRDAESGRHGRAVDDTEDAGRPAPDGGPQEPDAAAPTDELAAGEDDSPEGGDEGPMSEHHRWGDTAYGSAVD